jgi:hypothetical protein
MKTQQETNLAVRAGGTTARCGGEAPTRLLGLLAGLVLLLAAQSAAADTVAVTGGWAYENGLLVDDGASVNDEIHTGPGTSAIDVGNYSAGSGEVIAFTVGHVPTLETGISWTGSNDDAIEFPFDDLYTAKVTFWIVQGPFADGQSKATQACTRTEQLWTDERQGVGFHDVSFVDATACPDASPYREFDCDAEKEGVKTDVGYEADSVNVYLVNTVDYGDGPLSRAGCWRSNGSQDVVAIGWDASDDLLAHEIGHAFLGGDAAHTDTDELASHFDSKNVMQSSSNSRSFLTEGQTFRAAFNTGSLINSVFGRTGGTRSCSVSSTDTDDQDCPAVQTRIWADED